MTAEIITIGDELLIGQVIDTNSAYMAECLSQWGITLYQVTSVHDDAEHIQTALRAALSRVDIVLCTGGLGPTKDDITKQTFCDFFHTHLIEDEAVKAHIYRLYASRPEVLNRLTATQWQVPASCQVLENTVGSAPIMCWEGALAETDEHAQKLVISMPGVPYEMQYAMEHAVGEKIQAWATREAIEHQTLQVCGIPESSLAIQIEAWEEALPPYLHLAYLPKDGIIRLRLTGHLPFCQAETLHQEMEQQIAALIPLLDEHLLAREDVPLEVLVGRILNERRQTIASAESCTGGKIAAALSRHAGSSAFYMGSVVAYDNSVKQHVLGVSADDLQTYGAVSEPVVRQMAEGVRRLLRTDYAIATSGIAGPDGGTAEKPVGTVWIAVATPQGTVARCFHLGKLREQVTDRAVTQAFILLLRQIANPQTL